MKGNAVTVGWNCMATLNSICRIHEQQASLQLFMLLGLGLYGFKTLCKMHKILFKLCASLPHIRQDQKFVLLQQQERNTDQNKALKIE